MNRSPRCTLPSRRMDNRSTSWRARDWRWNASPRQVVIRKLQLRAFRGGEKPQVDIYLECSKGTYVRSLADDLGRILGCGAFVSALRRTRAGPFRIEDSLSLDTLEALKDTSEFHAMDNFLLPADAALGALPLVRLSESGGFLYAPGTAGKGAKCTPWWGCARRAGERRVFGCWRNIRRRASGAASTDCHREVTRTCL